MAQQTTPPKVEKVADVQAEFVEEIGALIARGAALGVERSMIAAIVLRWGKP